MGDLGKLIRAKGFKKMPKVKKIAKSGHTACVPRQAKNKQNPSEGPSFRPSVMAEDQCDHIW